MTLKTAADLIPFVVAAFDALSALLDDEDDRDAQAVLAAVRGIVQSVEMASTGRVTLEQARAELASYLDRHSKNLEFAQDLIDQRRRLEETKE